MRLRHKPLSLLLADVAQAYDIARSLDSQFDRLAERFLARTSDSHCACGNAAAAASHGEHGECWLCEFLTRAIPRAVVRMLGLPVTATSANAFGAPECTHAMGVRDQLGDRLPLIVDGGPTGRSLPTTIVDLSAGPEPGRFCARRNSNARDRFRTTVAESRGMPDIEPEESDWEEEYEPEPSRVRGIVRRVLRGIITLVLLACFGWFWWLFIEIRTTSYTIQTLPADAIAVFGAAEYNGRPSPVPECSPGTCARSLSARIGSVARSLLVAARKRKTIHK